MQIDNDQLLFWDEKPLPNAASNHLVHSLVAGNKWGLERTISAEMLTLSAAD